MNGSHLWVSVLAAIGVAVLIGGAPDVLNVSMFVLCLPVIDKDKFNCSHKRSPTVYCCTVYTGTGYKKGDT